MAGCRLELLLVLTWTLLPVSVRGWERINETELRSLYEPGERGEPHDPTGKQQGDCWAGVFIRIGHLRLVASNSLLPDG